MGSLSVVEQLEVILLVYFLSYGNFHLLVY
jgi:hypothetical protein